MRAGVPGDGQAARTLGDRETEALLRSLPGTVHVTAGMYANVYLGSAQATDAEFLRGDSSTLGYLIVKGHWMNGPGQVVARSDFLHQRGLVVGDETTLNMGGKRTQVSIVGEFLAGGFSVFSDWATLTELAPDRQATDYEIQLAPGTSVDTYIAAFTKAAGPGLNATADANQTSVGTVVVTSFASIFTLMLGLIAAMGVFNTVVLNTSERRRNLGMLKSIGMTPRQVTSMMIASMVPLGMIGGLLGLPVGIIAHRLIVPASAHAAGIDMPASMMNVWHAPILSLLALAGTLIAVLGAFIPARTAARLTVAEALRSE